MTLLVTGAGGMLGRAVAETAARLGHEVRAATRAELDVSDPQAVRRALLELRPDAVVNCAAYTDVDGAESDRATAAAVNCAGAGYVAAAAAEVGAAIVHVSTDYVFDGSKREPWLESDPTGPLGVYGETKLAGEQAVAQANAQHVIVRTAWLFGAGGRNFVDTMLALGAQREEVSVVTDQIGCPTWTVHLAGALVELAERPGEPGVHHVAASGACSWNELAREVFERARIGCQVLPATTEQFPRPARRPAYSVLGSERAGAIELAPWRQGVAEYLATRVAV
ncbi:MAG TPA: dTDP-4-dehydrorhamnose reductase [Solirubrobacteraceae bacterium]|jgi:dTDP-4-dehydrorhamnose reductase|nr:dTDP-4-dehydrorhamnose reductase [Solirubrobacteraceae bacterium]